MLIIGIVTADTNVSMWIKTNENVNSYTGIYGNGSKSVVIDGVNMTDVPYYIQRNERSWRKDRRFDDNDLAHFFKRTAKHILGIGGSGDEEINVARYLVEAIKEVIRRTVMPILQDHEYRIQALENSMEEIASESYCQGKIEVMKKYNLSSVECGVDTCKIINQKVICGHLESPTKYVITKR